MEVRNPGRPFGLPALRIHADPRRVVCAVVGPLDEHARSAVLAVARIALTSGRTMVLDLARADSSAGALVRELRALLPRPPAAVPT